VHFIKYFIKYYTNSLQTSL